MSGFPRVVLTAPDLEPADRWGLPTAAASVSNLAGLGNRAGKNTAMEKPDPQPSEQDEQQFTDLLQQLRVVQTGVQILSAFLLTLPFTQRFATLDTAGKALYGVSLIAAAVSTALVIAPVSYRQRVGRGALANVVKVAARLAEAGLAALMVAAVSAVTLAARTAFGSPWAIALGAAVTAVYLATWYLLPLWAHLRLLAEDR